ncbi:hypothetical protein C808_05023 [Lachnospiraceae bacterium M18-1]|nr:hypothetical protein C808_05023 [Lachnospiraceae bacterium M18-1]
MNIVAVIPARKGSKGIPNKNIRLLNGKPMIAYSINNALNSRYITDIIVSSDSKEIKSITNCLGVEFKDRKEELCADDITLDKVIYDAVIDKSYDIVITLQPTSPTLQVETLDKAIKYFIDNELDTLISAVNSPRLSWIHKDGKIQPTYSKRLNRQYLPGEYREAGAFVISKYNVINENTRIGKNVEIFEISKEEAIDIDDYSDLMYAEYILQRKTVAIYVNGNQKRGMGHIYRSLDLADEFYCKLDIYYNRNQTSRQMFGDTTHNLISVNNEEEIIDYVKKEQYKIFINDVLETSMKYMDKLRSASPDIKIINFEDEGEGVYKADLVINALYQNCKYHNMKVGERYYIAPKLFLFYSPISIKKEVETVFISFGGADPQNYTQRLLDIITKKKYQTRKFIVAVGRAYQNVDEIMKYNKYFNIKVFYDVDNMPELMSQCDIAITSRGRTGYELALLGIPTISMSQNQREERHGFVSMEHGFNYLGLAPSDTIIESNLNLYLDMNSNDRKEMQKKLLSNDLKSGRKRVMSLINNL